MIDLKISMAKTGKKTRSAARATDALPVLTLIVDENLGIKELNSAAKDFLGPDHKKALNMRKGEAFGCTHKHDAPDGCGHGRFCQICPIREAALTAWKDNRVVRRRTVTEIFETQGPREVHMLVTATPIPYRGTTRVLLVMEDINALVKLQEPVAICASCKRIREDDHYWEQLDVHFRRHLDLELSHGVCPDCSKLLYGGLLKSQPLEFRPRTASTKR